MNKKNTLILMIFCLIFLLTGCSNYEYLVTTPTREYVPVTTVSPEVGMTIGLIDPVPEKYSPETLIKIEEYNARVRNYNEIITKEEYDPLEMSEERQKILNQKEDLATQI
jgi:PBP1b-binding outer membrane lipoprotein LpoB